MRIFLATAALSLAALAATTATAADLHSSNEAVHISVVGKTNTQVRAEIREAVAKVCGIEEGCRSEAFADASRQLIAIRRVNAPRRVRVARATPANAVRVSVVGKTREQVMQDIRAAANTVCGAAADDRSAEARSCVDRAVAGATYQLRGVRFGSDQQFARS